MESSLRQSAQRTSGRGARPPAQSFEDFERDPSDEDALLDSLEEVVSAPGAGQAVSEQQTHAAFRDVSATNGFDFDAEEAALDGDELSDDDFPAAAPAADAVEQKPPATTASFAESDEAEYLAYGDEDDSDDGDDGASRGAAAERVILSIDLDDADGPAELEVRADTIPAAAALAFLQQHGLPPEYFEPLVRQVEQLQEALRREQAAHAEHLLVDLSAAEAAPVHSQAAAPRDWGASVGSDDASPALSLSVLSAGSAARAVTASKGTQTPPLSPKGQRRAAATDEDRSVDSDRSLDESAEDEVDLLEELDASFVEDRSVAAAPVAAVPAPAAAPPPVRRSSLLPVVPRSVATASATATAASRVFEEYRRPEPQGPRVAAGDGAARAPAALVDESDDEPAHHEAAEVPAWPAVTHAPQRVGQMIRRGPVAAAWSSLDGDRRSRPTAAAAAQPPAKAAALGGMVMRKKPPAALSDGADEERSRAPFGQREGRPTAAGRDGRRDSDDESDTTPHSRAPPSGRSAARSSGESRAAARPQHQTYAAQAAAKAAATSPLSSPTSTVSTASDGRGLRERGARPTTPSNGTKKPDAGATPKAGGGGFFSSFLRSKHSAESEAPAADDRGKSHVPAFLGASGGAGAGAGAVSGARATARDKGGRAATPSRGTAKIDLL